MDPTSGVTLDVTNGSTFVDDEQAKILAASSPNAGPNCDQNVDLKKARRVMLKRLESRRYRLKKKIYLTNLESQVKEIQVHIAYDLQPQIESELDQKATLILEQEMLNHQIKILENELLLKTALTRELEDELNMWKGLYTMQQEQQGIGSNEIEMLTTTVSEEHETNVNDLANNIGMMVMIPTPTFNNQ